MSLPVQTESSASKTKKLRQFMLVEQITHLPEGENYINTLETRLQGLDPAPVEYAFIVHNQDEHDDGTQVEPHLHLVLRFDNPRSISRVAKLLDVAPQYVKKWTGKINNAYSYLLHLTSEAIAEGKHQYESSEVTANFDFESKIQQISKSVSKSSASSDTAIINAVLDGIYAGKYEKPEDAYAMLNGHQIAKAKKSIDTAFTAYRALKAAQWLEARQESNRQTPLIWLYGIGGTGKTSMAKAMAEDFGIDFFMTGSHGDPFQAYLGQHYVILNELRPQEGLAKSYADLLSLLDPYNPTMASSRYSDKQILADYLVVTSPLDPLQFYKAMNTNENDGFAQLSRRAEYVVYMERDYVTEMKYDENAKRYAPIQGRRKNIWNPTSKFFMGNAQTEGNIDNAFKSLVHSESTDISPSVPDPDPLNPLLH